MKRYLYILLGALVLAACEPEVVAKVDFNFGTMTAETTEDSATLTTDIPFITVDGVSVDGASFRLEYRVSQSGMSYADTVTLTEYRTEGDKIIFDIEGLEPDTEYLAHIVLSHPDYGMESSEGYVFHTEEHIPRCEISCTSEVEAKGLTATITLSDVAYLVDGESVAIEGMELEYSPKDAEEWTAVAIANNKANLPAEGGDYLEENSDYRYRITITPTESVYEAIATDIKQFKTAYAVIEADIAKPNLTIDGEKLNAEVESAKVYYDGIERTDDCSYYIYYRKAGATDWSTKAEVEYTASGMALSIALADLDEGTKYEFSGAIVAGAKREVCTSEVATITTPKEEEPTPEPPTPPMGGNSDTTAIAGIWHLSEWRGTTPSFDVYLNISEEGVVTLLQRLTSREWELYYSTVEYSDNTVWGTYTDGAAWSASYSVAIAGDQMTWTNTADATDISVYTRSEWPATQSRCSAAVDRGERFL